MDRYPRGADRALAASRDGRRGAGRCQEHLRVKVAHQIGTPLRSGILTAHGTNAAPA